MRSAIVALAVAISLTIPLRAAGPGTIHNDDSCDIGVYPAATLLVPYFEVDIDSGAGTGETTIFTVTNVTNLPQAVRVTLWTDYAFPVIAFDLYLTGYDVQSINLYDVIRRGHIAPDSGTGSKISPVGELSGTSWELEFDNPTLDERSCAEAAPVALSVDLITRMQQAFTVGKTTATSCGSRTALGGPHLNAVGYITLDVVGRCGGTLPTDPEYFTRDIRYDNVLTGDYMQVNGDEDFAQAAPMVHIRAIPEGGARADAGATFAQTFYSRLQPVARRTGDRRQPLPSTFAARWISGGATGFETFFKIWRSVDTPADAPCGKYAVNGQLPIAEIVRFDEEENPSALEYWPPYSTPEYSFPATSLADVSNTLAFPPNPGGAVAGWMYLNLHNERSGASATQNWVIVSMRAEERFSADFEATSLGNGCSPAAALSEASGGNPVIGPSPNRP